MNRRVLMLLLILLAAASSSLFGLELTKGKVRLVLSENTGRFSLYYKSAANEWTPLFYAQDPRTSSLEVLAGKELYHMGDSPKFKQTVTKTPVGGQISWVSDQISVTERFAFRTSVGASGADGVLVTIGITNTSKKPVSIGARYLIDTYLGEQSRIEFVTPSEQSMSNETEFTGSNIPTYWVSPKDKKMTVALEVITRSFDVTQPDRIIFANWKRLSESQWDFTSDSSRNFTMLPYSVNDSAVEMYYDARQLQPGASRTIRILMGQYSKAGWGQQTATSSTSPASGAETSATAVQAPAAGPANPEVTKLLEQASSSQASPSSSEATPSAAPAADTRTTMLSDLKTVDGVLEQIQKMLASPGSVTQSDVEVLRKVLDTLNERKTQSSQQ